MPDRTVTVNRTLVGVLTILLLLAAGGVALFVPLDATSEGWVAALLRTGVLLGALWLALASKTRPAAWADIPRWKAVVALALLILTAWRPRMVLPLLILFAIFAYFTRPRKRK